MGELSISFKDDHFFMEKVVDLMHSLETTKISLEEQVAKLPAGETKNFNDAWDKLISGALQLKVQ